MDDMKGCIEDGRTRYPDADPADLERIAVKATETAEMTQAVGREEGIAFSAEQPEYGCAWQWGDGTATYDQATGEPIRDDDEAPCARVFDCDGNTIAIVRLDQE